MGNSVEQSHQALLQLSIGWRIRGETGGVITLMLIDELIDQMGLAASRRPMEGNDFPFG
jgi:hypothetical protein